MLQRQGCSGQVCEFACLLGPLVSFLESEKAIALGNKWYWKVWQKSPEVEACPGAVSGEKFGRVGVYPGNAVAEAGGRSK